MILFYHGIQVLTLSDLTDLWKSSVMLEGADDTGLPLVTFPEACPWPG